MGRGWGEGSEHNRTFWPRLHMFWPLLHVGEGVGGEGHVLGVGAGCKVTGGMREVTYPFFFFFSTEGSPQPGSGAERKRSGADRARDRTK